MAAEKRIVCLIDDDNIYQYTARVILESTGLTRHIHSFYNGREALNYLTEHCKDDAGIFPDVIFLDINMPVMNGWEFLEEYLKLHPSLPKPVVVYVVSSSVDTGDMRKSLSYEVVSDYLVKPVNRSKYQELMESL
ncbi:MAG TPA: response regulator [Sediminibacterium sp.]|nr:response regulator [Sediminibacterium sp.]